jgi:hypothetical protein
MKSARLQLALFACLALIPGAGYADEQRIGGPVPSKPPQSGHKAAAKAKPLKPLPRPAPHPPSAIATNRGRASAGSFPTPKGAAIQPPIAGKSRTRPPSAAAPLLSDIRHRSPNPAVITGAPDFSKRNPGAIDGRQMHRRP